MADPEVGPKTTSSYLDRPSACGSRGRQWAVPTGVARAQSSGQVFLDTAEQHETDITVSATVYCRLESRLQFRQVLTCFDRLREPFVVFADQQCGVRRARKSGEDVVNDVLLDGCCADGYLVAAAKTALVSHLSRGIAVEPLEDAMKRMPGTIAYRDV